MSVVLIWLLIDIDTSFSFLMTQKRKMKVGSAAKVEYSYLVFSNAGVDQNWKLILCNTLTDAKIVTNITRDTWLKINWKIMMMNDPWENDIKYNIFIIVQYTIAENVPFVVQSHKNYNKINIIHSPSWFWL